MLSELVHVLVTWTREVLGPLGAFGLFILAFIESIFFPIPVDVLLAVLVLSDRSLWPWYALVATVGSVLGAAVAYRIGFWGEYAILERFFKKSQIDRVHALFERHQSVAIFVAGLTPIPYKVFAIAAGVFYIRFWPFIVVSALSRGLRFFLVAAAFAWFSTLPPIINALTILAALLLMEGWISYRLWFSSRR